MSITAECNVCGRKYQAPDNLAGKRVRCKQCGNIFELPFDPNAQQGPDLDALAEMERTHHSLDATATGGNAPNEDAENEDGDSPRPLRTGRTNVRFNFPMARELDRWMPTILTVGGFACLAAIALRHDTTVPRWIPPIRVAVAVIGLALIISPLMLSMIRQAGRKVGYQMPVNDKPRGFATAMVAFVLTYLLWTQGDGDIIALFLGSLVGVTIATAATWLLFRLRPNEIAPTAVYSGIGFMIGVAIVGGIMFGINMLLLQVLLAVKKPDLVPASPLGPGFAWITTEQRDAIVAELAKTAPRPTPVTTTQASPEPPPPAPVVNSPIVRNIQPAPITGQFEDILRPVVDSRYVGVVRKGTEVSTSIVELWDTAPWEKKNSATFNIAVESGKRRVMSPDGQSVARIVTFPRLSVQLWNYTDDRVRQLYFNEAGTPELIGFLDNSRLLLLWQRSRTQFALEVVDAAIGKRLLVIETPNFELTGNALAISRDGALAAITAKVNNAPTVLIYSLTKGGTPITTVPISSLDPRWPLAPTGMAFSRDGGQLAILFEQSGNGLLLSYQVDVSKTPMASPIEHVDAEGRIARIRPVRFSGSSIEWLQDASGWIIYGQGVFSKTTGRMVAELGVAGVQSCYVRANDVLELITVSPQQQLQLLQLDMPRLSTMIRQ